MAENCMNMCLFKKNDIKLLLQTKHLSDCTFIIEGVKVKAHKLILSCSSPVFEKMFYGEMASDEIIISDINLDDFNQILEFIYTHNISISSILNAWSLIYIAQKYLLNDIIHICTTYVEKNLTINNLVLSYEYSEMFGLDKLKEKCLNDIINYTKGIFSPEFYYQMKPNTLTLILQKKLNINHAELFIAILQWAIIECDNISIEKLPENIFKILIDFDILKYLMNLQIHLLPTYKLVDEIIFESYNLFKKKYLKSVKFNEKYFINISWTSFCKSRTLYKISQRVDLVFAQNFICYVSVNRKIALFGLVVTVEDYSNNIQTKNETFSDRYYGMIVISINEIRNNNNSQLIHTRFANTLFYDTPCYIPLEELAILEADRMYSIKICYLNMNNTNCNSSIVCYYMNSTIVDEEKKVIFVFNEMCGGVIRGVSYYPI